MMWQRAKILAVPPTDPPWLVGAYVWVTGKPYMSKSSIGAFTGLSAHPHLKIKSNIQSSRSGQQAGVAMEYIELLGGEENFREDVPLISLEAWLAEAENDFHNA